MKQVKQIIEFILVLASCFFRNKKQQKGHAQFPEDPYPPGPCNGRKGDCPCGTGCACNTEPPQSPGQSGVSYLPANIPGKGSREENPRSQGEGSNPANNSQEGPDNSAGGAAGLLGWCLITVAGTSYLYKLLV